MYTVLKEKIKEQLQLVSDAVRDEFNGVWYAKYSISVQYQLVTQSSYVDSGVSGSAVATTAAKTLRTSGGFFEGHKLVLRLT